MLDILSSKVLLVLGDLSDGATPPDARGYIYAEHSANPIKGKGKVEKKKMLMLMWW